MSSALCGAPFSSRSLVRRAGEWPGPLCCFHGCTPPCRFPSALLLRMPEAGWCAGANGQSLAKVTWPVGADPVVASAAYLPMASPPHPHLVTLPLPHRPPPAPTAAFTQPSSEEEAACPSQALLAPGAAPRGLWWRLSPVPLPSHLPPSLQGACARPQLLVRVAPSLLAGHSPTSLALESLTSDLCGFKDFCLCFCWHTPEPRLPPGFVPEFFPGRDPSSVSLLAANPPTPPLLTRSHRRGSCPWCRPLPCPQAAPIRHVP